MTKKQLVRIELMACDLMIRDGYLKATDKPSFSDCMSLSYDELKDSHETNLYLYPELRYKL